jgi:hypothetical protein
MGPRTETFALGSIFFFINYGFEVYEDRCLDEDPREHGPRVVDLLQDMVLPELDGDPVVDEVIRACWFGQFARVADLAAHMQTLVTEVETNVETKGGEHKGRGCGDGKQDEGKEDEGKEDDGEQSDAQSDAGEGDGEQNGQRVNGEKDDGKQDEAEKGDGEKELKEQNGEVDNSEQDHKEGAGKEGNSGKGYGEDFGWKRALCRHLEQRGLLQLLSAAEPEQLGFRLEWYRHRSDS